MSICQVAPGLTNRLMRELLTVLLFACLATGATWGQVVDQARVFPADGWEFGNALASAGNTLVVGDAFWNANPSRTTLGCAYVYTLARGQWAQQAELRARDGKAFDLFGTSVATTGSVMAVGAPDHGQTGAVYLFLQSGGIWGQVQEIKPADGKPGDEFGCAVAMTSTTLAIGACHKAGFAGTVYLYALYGNTWKLQAELPAPAAAATGHSLFGYAVALSGSNLLVGAPGQNASAGAAYVYVFKNGQWTQQAQLGVAGAIGPTQFGWSVALSGNIAAIGAPDISAVTLFQSGKNGWAQTAVLNAFEGPSVAGFGTALAMNATTLVVSAVNANDQSAYVFTLGKSGWTPQYEFSPFDDSLNNEQFGAAVALMGNEPVVARPHSWDGTTAPGTPLGALYGFTVGGAEAIASDGQYGDDYGYAVALAGTTVLAGAPGCNGGTGAVYVSTLKNGGLTPQSVLTASNGQPGDGFGAALAFDGTNLFVGAPYANNGQGAVYLYTYKAGVWTYQAELTAGDGQPGDLFGDSLALSGTQIGVGAPGRNGNMGAAYVFAMSGTAWSQQAELIAGDGESADGFGTSVALDRGNLVVGSPNATTTEAVGAGAAYVYSQSGTQWSLVTKLSAPFGQFGDGFGTAVGLSGNEIAVGAPYSSFGAGAVFLFQDIDLWALQTTLIGPCVGLQEQFGSALLLYGNTLLVGDSGHDSATGGLLLYSQTGSNWVLNGGLTAADGQPLDSFGSSIALSGGTIAIGAPYANAGTGALYAH
jgi:hypothetical protein